MSGTSSITSGVVITKLCGDSFLFALSCIALTAGQVSPSLCHIVVQKT